ncbi:NPFG-protein-coupled receptor [Daphnia sinensis]|uniref:NPFG-protein-coupled receptor n=1 Tax=Daphnia sinensis TaxID=1820382 RepID=A0AAD5L4N5_9CRUS|nr:NPFG-protein-coupled receptor [Daphnia sinensis]
MEDYQPLDDSFDDPHNLTAWIMQHMERTEGGLAGQLNHTTIRILVHNLTSLLLKHHSNGGPGGLINFNINPDDEHYWSRVMENRRVGYGASCVLITLYSVLIMAGSLGNCLVIWAVIRQPTMRTLRNTFITNLAVSDLLLCLVTMPLTLLEIITKYWPLGDSVISCKLAGGLQAVSIFVSTMSITAISLDRYQLIVYPTTDYLKRIGAAAGLFSIWALSFFLAAPMFLFRSLDHHSLWPSHYGIGVESVDYCYENWPVAHGRALYSAATILLQYAAPILIVSVVHAKICRRLRLRQSLMMSMGKDSKKQASEKQRLRRLNSLLLTIAFIFAICWMPLNVYNLVLDLYNPFQKPEDQETMLIIYAVCHVLGMSSACANPWLYGWYNDNFRNEFRDIVSPLLRCFGRHCPALATSISVSRSSSRQKAVQRPDASVNGMNGGGVGGTGVLNGEDERSQIACTDDDDNLPHLINNIPMTSMQINQLTCEVEMTYSSCIQSTIQSSDML